MGWPLLLLVSYLAMYCQDILGTVMVQAEARGRAHLAAACDMAQDGCNMASLGILGSAFIGGHDIPLTLAIAASRLAADYSGTYSGVKLGGRLMRGRACPCGCPGAKESM